MSKALTNAFHRANAAVLHDAVGDILPCRMRSDRDNCQISLIVHEPVFRVLIGTVRLRGIEALAFN
jgi:hypothetical protein